MKTAGMKGTLAAALAVTLIAGAASAEMVWFSYDDGLQLGGEESDITSVAYGDGNATLVVSHRGGTTQISAPAAMSFGETVAPEVIVSFTEGAGVRVTNPLAFEGVESAIASAGHVTVTTTGTDEVTVRVSGTTADGQLKVYGTAPVRIILDNATIANATGAPVNVQSIAGTVLELHGTSALSDSKKYTTPEGESQKGAVHSAGPLRVEGDGSVTIAAACKHGICCDYGVTIASGCVEVLAAASDGVHSEGFLMSGGRYASVATTGDGIDAGAGTALIEGGEIEVSVPTADTKGVKADGDITISGGSLTLDVPSDQSKGIKTKGRFVMTGGSIVSTTSGAAVVVDGDPSYCTTIKVDGDLLISGGSVTVRATGAGNKGISVDGDATFTGGVFDISCSGDGATYTDVNGLTDTYSSTCITVDGALALDAGEFTLANSGTAGKCIKSDTSMTIGTTDGGPAITATTTGERILESESTDSGTGTGGWGGPGAPGGGGQGAMDNADYSNPKVVKCDGDLTVNGGVLKLTSTQEGGEGLESKATLTINGGDLDISTVDDCINATTHVQINGGTLHCIASNNDAIDSNGTLSIAGGTVIAAGAKSPEEGLDCDQNRFSITGGTVFAMGGATSTPTESACTQRCFIYTASATKGSLLTVTAPDGSHLLTVRYPKTLSSATLLISASGITTGTHTIYTGGSVTGGTTVYEVTTGGDYTPGTAAKTFSPTKMVTTVSNR